MNNYYIVNPTNNDILHFGKGHDDRPPGRGSGRFAWGSGKRPKQALEKNKKPKTEEEKENIIRSNRAKDIRSIQSELSTRQLEDAKKRLDLNASISEYAAREEDANWNKINRAMKRVNDVVNWTSTGIKAWNNFAAVYNSSVAGTNGKSKLPGISMPNVPNKDNKK